MKDRFFCWRRLWALAVLFCIAGLLAGCAAPPASGGAGSQTGQAQEAAALPDDGTLRYQREAGVLFCGAQLVYTAGPHDTVRLLTDDCTGKTEYFVIGSPQGSDQYVYTLYDRTGAALYELGERSGLYLCDGWLLICGEDYGVDQSSSDHCALLQLSTGREISLPDNISWLHSPQEGILCVSQCHWNYAGGRAEYNVYLYDTEGNLLQTIAGFYSSWGENIPEGWIILSGDAGNRLYCIDTGLTLEGYAGNCGGGLVCLETAVGYDLAELSSGRVLEHNERRYVAFLDDGTVFYDGNDVYGGRREYRLVAKDGSMEAVDCVYDLQNGLCALRTENSVRLYEDGALVFEKPFTPAGDDSWISMSIRADQRQVLVDDWQELPDRSGSLRTYRLLGTDLERKMPSSDYTYLDFSENVPYGYGIHAYNGTGSVLYDILAEDGTVLVANVAEIHGLEAGFFACRRGFEEGWMDLDGQWLWSQSIWQDGQDDGTETYW